MINVLIVGTIITLHYKYYLCLMEIEPNALVPGLAVMVFRGYYNKFCFTSFKLKKNITL